MQVSVRPDEEAALAHYINPGLLLQIAAAFLDQGYGPQRALAADCLADVDALIDRRQDDFHARTHELVLIRLGTTASHDEHGQAARRGLRTIGGGKLESLVERRLEIAYHHVAADRGEGLGCRRRLAGALRRWPGHSASTAAASSQLAAAPPLLPCG